MLKLLANLLFQGLHQKPHNNGCFSKRKIRKADVFFDLSLRGGFTYHSSFFLLLTLKVTMGPLAITKSGAN
jgi:hypothetical protein